MSKPLRNMTKAELIAELARLSSGFEPAGSHQTAVLELETYKEEARVQTDQLIEAQRLLEESRDRYADLYESAPLPYLTLDAEGIIRDINLTGANLLQLERDEILDRPFVCFVSSDSRRTWLDHVHRWNEELDEDVFELSIDQRNSQAIVEVVTRPVQRDGGPIYRVALVDRTKEKRAVEEIRRLNASLEERVRDRTAELQAANAELRNADRRKNEFLAMLGHELRGPLAGVGNGLALLRLSDLSIEQRAEAMRIMDRQLANMAALLNDLLDVSRVTLGKVKLHKQVHDINEMIQAAVQSCHDIIVARRHDLRIEFCSGPCRAECDRLRVEQMITNLLHNAAKYTDPGGQIRVSARREGPDLRIDVIDNGCGMSEDIQRRAFDLFSQADSSIDRTEGGLGIGLTMVKSLAELHGGEVEGYSEGLGKGSRFTVWLPACDAPTTNHVPQSPPESSPPMMDNGSLKIVLVEDNADSANLLKLLLSRWGHEVQIAGDGVAGLQSIQSMRPNVAIIDIGLPQLDGFALARQLRSEFPSGQLLLVALTGYGSDEDRRRASEAGFDEHLTKPVSINQLRGALRLARRS